GLDARPWRGPFIERVAGDFQRLPVRGRWHGVFMWGGAIRVRAPGERIGLERRPGPPDSGVSSLSLVLLERAGRPAGRGPILPAPVPPTTRATSEARTEHL